MKTQNEDYGFYGTIARNDVGIDPDVAWEVALDALIDRGATPEIARDFLDSTYGRQVADQIKNAECNVNDALLACFGTEPRLRQAIRRIATN